MLTYGQLPESTLQSGVAIYCSKGCDEGYSATRGDYFMAADDAPVMCGECGSPMFLGRRVVTVERV